MNKSRAHALLLIATRKNAGLSAPRLSCDGSADHSASIKFISVFPDTSVISMAVRLPTG